MALRRLNREKADISGPMAVDGITAGPEGDDSAWMGGWVDRWMDSLQCVVATLARRTLRTTAASSSWTSPSPRCDGPLL